MANIINYNDLLQNKSKLTNIDDAIANNLYLREYYIKDFKYLDPNEIKLKTINTYKHRNISNCKLFAKLWLQEVFKGLKQFLYEGSLHGVK